MQGEPTGRSRYSAEREGRRPAAVLDVWVPEHVRGGPPVDAVRVQGR